MRKMITAVITAVTIFGAYITYHELAHYQIMVMHGCTDIMTKITIQSFNIWCESYAAGTTAEILKQEAFLHSLNEIVGYHLVPLLLILWWRSIK